MVQAIRGFKLSPSGLKFWLRGTLPRDESLAFTLENVLSPTVRTCWEALYLGHWDSGKEGNGHALVNHQIESVQGAMLCGSALSEREMAKDRMVDTPVFQ